MNHGQEMYQLAEVVREEPYDYIFGLRPMYIRLNDASQAKFLYRNQIEQHLIQPHKEIWVQLDSKGKLVDVVDFSMY